MSCSIVHTQINIQGFCTRSTSFVKGVFSNNSFRHGGPRITITITITITIQIRIKIKIKIRKRIRIRTRTRIRIRMRIGIEILKLE